MNNYGGIYNWVPSDIDLSQINSITIANTNASADPIRHKAVHFNEKAGVTVVVWEDGTKTIVKTCEGDTFDKERGYLQAYFEKAFGESKTQANLYLKDAVNNASSQKKVEKVKAKKKKNKKKKK